ncbi:hypothetical protein WJX81_006813 [Elliptochloris bilobata]|uniref:Uncharacterized protein n=1 Tax=Elliptochloris bilobata TaxID=381761 RepID=A0AAW1S8Q7_9CHLO
MNLEITCEAAAHAGGGHTVRRVGCSRHAGFSCERSCAALAWEPWRSLPLPRNVSEDVAGARAEWQRFMAAAPAFPDPAFSGRGVVILAGGPTYLVPAWVSVNMLRQTGCALPVEMFFPGADEDLAGFALKVAALILSSFEEVLFLDADNVVVSDPAPLFAAPAFQSTGALLWPDYWASTAAPDLAAILGVDALPRGSHESGQMLLSKRRAWDALMLAAFMNLRAGLYYELLSCYMGKGDKETFAAALTATGAPFAVVPTPHTAAAAASRGGALTMGLQGFHPLNAGIDFRDAYRWGLHGTFLQFTEVTLCDRWQHWVNSAVLPRLAWLHRAWRRVLGHEDYFHLW